MTRLGIVKCSQTQLGYEVNDDPGGCCREMCLRQGPDAVSRRRSLTEFLGGVPSTAFFDGAAYSPHVKPVDCVHSSVRPTKMEHHD